MSDNDAAEKKRLMILVAGASVIVLIAVGLTFLIASLGDKDTDGQIKSDVVVSEVDKSLAQSSVSEFLGSVGNFGFKYDAINSANVLAVVIDSANNPGNNKTYFRSRSEAYNEGRKNVLPDGPAYIDAGTVESWTNAFEIDRIASFELTNLDVSVSPKGSYTEVNGVDRLTAYADVTFTSVQTNGAKTADDLSWDGTFNISRKTFSENTAKVVLVRDADGEWKIYSFKDLTNYFLLANWSNPSTDEFVEEQRGFENFYTIVSDDIANMQNSEEG